MTKRHSKTYRRGRGRTQRRGRGRTQRRGRGRTQRGGLIWIDPIRTTQQ